MWFYRNGDEKMSIGQKRVVIENFVEKRMTFFFFFFFHFGMHLGITVNLKQNNMVTKNS